MNATQLYERLEIVKDEIGCMQKGFGREAGNFEIENVRLTATEKKLKKLKTTR